MLHVVDPIPFSEDEDRAEQFGLQAANVGDKNVYFGLAGSNSVGTTDTIPFFDPEPSKEAFLEYDLARLVYNLANPKKTVVGLLSGAPIGGSFDPQTQQPTQPWVIVEQARQVFDLRMLPESTLKIDDDINVLWIVHPAMLDDATQYAIDQFVMRGGRALSSSIRWPRSSRPGRSRPASRRRRARISTSCSRPGASSSPQATSSRTTATRSASGRASDPFATSACSGSTWTR